MSYYLGIDTSNYTTSLALYNSDTYEVVALKKLLPVKSGEKGIRQSDAVFHHTIQIEELLGELKGRFDGVLPKISGVGVSYTPRRVEGSYMPCFMVGVAVARAIAVSCNVPLYKFSHQEGHIAAALYSADKLEFVGKEFLAFHVSGGTTESLFVRPCVDAGSPLIATQFETSTDLKAGQAIDRVGVMMGLDFPCGPALEKLALKSSAQFEIKPSITEGGCSLSGVENKCRKMIDDGVPFEDVALFCLKYIEASLLYMTRSLVEKYPGLPVVFSGGVMSNSLIRGSLSEVCEAYFAEPQFSSDNAAGVAILAALY